MVSQKKIIEELRFLSKAAGFEANEVADIIESEGIAPPDGWRLVPASKALECPKCKVQRGIFPCALKDCPSAEEMLTAAKDKP